ncbi:MAG: class B sortase [Chloroflexi bacterium]|jgi:sortase B|nr:class B sortase [Chloroflexota bacterium]
MNTKNKKWIYQKWHSVVLRVLIALSLVAVVFFAYTYFRVENEYQAGNDYYQNIRAEQLVFENIQYDAKLTATPALSPELDQEQSMESTASIEEQPAVKTGSMDFSYLKLVNDDVVAWLTADGLPIDLPVVQGDDNDYYLTRLFDRQYNRLGTLFVDANNKGDFSDKNTAIYGHNMNDGSMFASLIDYQSQEFYESFPSINLFTPNGDYRIELFAGQVVNADDALIRFSFEDDIDFMNYVEQLKLYSTFDSPVVLNPEDQMITLSTCAYYFENARYIVYGKLVPLP